MTTLEGFQPVTDVVADNRGRVTISKAGAHSEDRYAVSKNAEGFILLTPLATIPRHELLVWENAELRASLFRGLAEAAEGKAAPLDWVTAGVNLTDDPEGDDTE
ncbi:hypothetical protein [Amycolatopsis sp. PS_44_ISF1]|uniref:hypothetical protein n=1 Tax=Amycolatopsis sp. PS_44_ISF1 TaxID=2974917 RepID=UPI0028DF784A|nr:hypothetical protein [Amycolatopsis sp. PS_44_ISF1]MDT8916244.1 hypothetical protein [Amycolatopsis sp. PS_44_ISF1]